MTNNLRSMRVNLEIALKFSRKMAECLHYSANATKRYEGSSHLFNGTFMVFSYVFCLRPMIKTIIWLVLYKKTSEIRLCQYLTSFVVFLSFCLYFWTDSIEAAQFIITGKLI